MSRQQGVQQIRQSLRELGLDDSGSKRAMLKRLEDASRATRSVAAPAVRNVRVAVCKPGGGKPAFLVVQAVSSAKNFQAILTKAGNKLRMKATRLFLTSGEEIFADSVSRLLVDDINLVVTRGEKFEPRRELVPTDEVASNSAGIPVGESKRDLAPLESSSLSLASTASAPLSDGKRSSSSHSISLTANPSLVASSSSSLSDLLNDDAPLDFAAEKAKAASLFPAGFEVRQEDLDAILQAISEGVLEKETGETIANDMRKTLSLSLPLDSATAGSTNNSAGSSLASSSVVRLPDSPRSRAAGQTLRLIESPRAHSAAAASAQSEPSLSSAAAAAPAALASPNRRVASSPPPATPPGAGAGAGTPSSSNHSMSTDSQRTVLNALQSLASAHRSSPSAMRVLFAPVNSAPLPSLSLDALRQPQSTLTGAVSASAAVPPVDLGGLSRQSSTASEASLSSHAWTVAPSPVPEDSKDEQNSDDEEAEGEDGEHSRRPQLADASGEGKRKARWKDEPLDFSLDSRGLPGSPALKPEPAPTEAHEALLRELDQLRGKNAELIRGHQVADRTNKKLQAQNKSMEKADKKLKEEIVRLTLQVTKLKGAQEKFSDVQATLSKQEQVVTKLTRERDRLRDKSKSLAARVVELEAATRELKESQQLCTSLQSRIDFLCGNDLKTRSPAELDQLFKHHTESIGKVTNALTQALEKERKDLKDRRLCKICYDKEIQCLLLPCCHYIACETCANGVARCPVCRRPITERKPVYC